MTDDRPTEDARRLGYALGLLAVLDVARTAQEIDTVRALAADFIREEEAIVAQVLKKNQP